MQTCTIVMDFKLENNKILKKLYTFIQKLFNLTLIILKLCLTEDLHLIKLDKFKKPFKIIPKLYKSIMIMLTVIIIEE